MLFMQPLHAQELLCTVKLDYSQIQGDKQIFADMEQTIIRYMNFTAFTNDTYTPTERIRCNILISVNDRPQPDEFKCVANIQAFRPAYGATYETPIFNSVDKNFNFTYVAYQQLQFSENTYVDNLTSILNFYAYTIIGLDMDSYGLQAGDPYFQRAQQVVTLATNSPELGWRANESLRNRYWLAENLLNNAYKPFHEAMYKYHRQGVDVLASNLVAGRKAILDTVKSMNQLNKQRPQLMITQVFIDMKDGELVQVFSNDQPAQRTEFINTALDWAPGSSKFQQMQSSIK